MICLVTKQKKSLFKITLNVKNDIKRVNIISVFLLGPHLPVHLLTYLQT